jgi:hypothetical protein
MDSDNRIRAIRKDLQELADLLEAHNYRLADLTKSLTSESDTELWNFLTSNSLWGGAGSIADQALLESSDARRKLEEILIRIGGAQQGLERANVRTEMWISFFQKRR